MLSLVWHIWCRYNSWRYLIVFYFHFNKHQWIDLKLYSGMYMYTVLNTRGSVDWTFHRCFPSNFGSFGKAVSEKNFRNRPIWNKNCLWRPCLLMDRDKMSNLYRGPPIDASYQVSVHLAKRFQRRRFFRNQPIRNKNCLWWPCLLTDRDEMSNIYRGLSIDAFYQVSVHLAKRFQRRF
jgi:hypothetical protein